jgi:hypothetical protein
MTASFRSVLPLVVLLICLPSSEQLASQTKPILVGVRVESEGGGKGQGMWTQEAFDLSPQETKDLEALVKSAISEKDIKLVPTDYPEDYIGVVVVAAKLPKGRGGNWYIASSVITIAKKDGRDELVTHNVIAQSDLTSLAHNIGLIFATMRLRAASGLWK